MKRAQFDEYCLDIFSIRRVACVKVCKRVRICEGVFVYLGVFLRGEGGKGKEGGLGLIVVILLSFLAKILVQ